MCGPLISHLRYPGFCVTEIATLLFNIIDAKKWQSFPLKLKLKLHTFIIYDIKKCLSKKIIDLMNELVESQLI